MRKGYCLIGLKDSNGFYDNEVVLFTTNDYSLIMSIAKNALINNKINNIYKRFRINVFNEFDNSIIDYYPLTLDNSNNLKVRLF